MTAVILLQTLTQRGFDLRPEGDGIRIIPASALTNEFRNAIREHKAELIELLSVTRASEALEIVEAAHHRHTWQAGENEPRFDLWESTDGGTLSGAFGEPAGRQLMAAAIADGCCPECRGPLGLLDRERNAWRCAGCEVTFYAGAVQ